MNFLPPVMVDIGYGCVFYKHFQVDGGVELTGPWPILAYQETREGEEGRGVPRVSGSLFWSIVCYFGPLILKLFYETKSGKFMPSFGCFSSFI